MFKIGDILGCNGSGGLYTVEVLGINSDRFYTVHHLTGRYSGLIIDWFNGDGCRLLGTTKKFINYEMTKFKFI